jgi:hypothetical protein
MTAPYPVRARRPAGVTLLVVLIVIGGILQVAGGVLLVLGHNNATVIREAKTSSDRLLWFGIGAIVIGVIYLLVSRGLAHGNGLARFIVGLLSLLSLAGGVWAIVTQHGNLRNQGISSAIVGLVVLLLLYSPKANAFFRTN